MPRNWISYEMLSMFVGGLDAFNESFNTGSAISRLDFIQDYGFSFDTQRQQLKQIGSTSLALNSTQLAPDVNLRFSYYLNDGWNEDFIGFQITSGSFNNFISSETLTATHDRNFYIAIAPNEYSDSVTATSLNTYNILGIGNAYINSYNLNVAVGGLATVSCDFVGANATISTYSANNYMPSVNTDVTGQTASGANRKYGLELYDGSKISRYITGYKNQFNGGCPFGKVSFTASEAFGSDAMSFGEVFGNLQSFDLNINFERKSMYGFGNNYPFARKLQRPIIATVSLESIVSGFAAENLAETFSKEDVTISGYNFNVIFKNNNNVEKFGVRISGAKLDSYEIGSQIGGQSRVTTNWSFPITDGSELLVSGSRPVKNSSSLYVNESINNLCLEYGTYISSYCAGIDFVGVFADGNCGTFTQVIEYSSPLCGGGGYEP